MWLLTIVASAIFSPGAPDELSCEGSCASDGDLSDAGSGVAATSVFPSLYSFLIRNSWRSYVRVM